MTRFGRPQVGDGSALEETDFLISYTNNIFPEGEALTALDILELRGDCDVLLEARYTGEAPGYVEGPRLVDDVRPHDTTAYSSTSASISALAPFRKGGTCIKGRMVSLRSSASPEIRRVDKMFAPLALRT